MRRARVRTPAVLGLGLLLLVATVPAALSPGIALAPAAVSAAEQAPAGQTEPRPAGEKMEQAVVKAVNEARRERDLPALGADRRLAEVARQYSCRMARQEFFRHESPSGSTMADRLEEAGIAYRAAGENLARIEGGDDHVGRAVSGWLDSPGHRENMLSPRFTATGVGACRAGRAVFFTQLFLRPR